MNMSQILLSISSGNFHFAADLDPTHLRHRELGNPSLVKVMLLGEAECSSRRLAGFCGTTRIDVLPVRVVGTWSEHERALCQSQD